MIHSVIPSLHAYVLIRNFFRNLDVYLRKKDSYTSLFHELEGSGPDLPELRPPNFSCVLDRGHLDTLENTDLQM